MDGNQNNWICDVSIRGFLIEILLHIYNVEQNKYAYGANALCTPPLLP